MPRLPSHRRLDAVETWVFDLDNTLYDARTRLFEQIDARIREYVAAFLGVDADEAHRVQKRYFREYGTTMTGMMARHGMDPGPFLDHVHDIDLASIGPAPALAAALAGLAGRKVIFTNADSRHAGRIMDRLGVRAHFDGVFDIVDAGYVPKPAPEVYDRLVARFGVDPARAAMVEDMARNLVPAAALGMTTVWVRTASDWGREGADGDHVHHVTDDLVGWLSAVADAE